MQLLPVDLVGLVAVIMGISIVLIPVMGLTARYALKPTVEALGRFFDHRGLDDTVALLERRMSLLEQQMESLDSSVRRLAEVSEFHRQLKAGEGGEAAPSTPAGPSTESPA